MRSRVPSSGAGTLYQDLKTFFDWYSAEYETVSPMAGIPRPKGKARIVPVLRPEQLRNIPHRLGDDAAGVPLRPHMLRHAATHYALESGARVSDLMEVRGWSSSAMLRVYGAELKQERAIAAMRQHQVGKVLRGMA